PDGTITFSGDSDGDGIPNDTDLCPTVASPNNTDADGDGHAAPCDCNEADATSWGVPTTEATDFTFTTLTAFGWTTPTDPGGNPEKYDIFRSSSTAGAMGCFQPDLTGNSSTDGGTPAAGGIFYYIVRPQTSCGTGPAGTTLGLASCP